MGAAGGGRTNTKQPPQKGSGRRGSRLWGSRVTYHAGDVASLLQHLGQGGLVERKASHRGDGKVVRDSIAKA